jgi:hypothetical protein
MAGVPSGAGAVLGKARIVAPNAASLKRAVPSTASGVAAPPTRSIAGNLIYTVGLDTVTGTYSLIAVNPDTDALMSSTPYGSAMGDNPLQLVSMISPSGVLYQGTKAGLLRVQAIVPAWRAQNDGEPTDISRSGCGLAEARQGNGRRSSSGGG